MPLDVAKELTFTGRVISGTEAKELGLATRVSETPLDDALALARRDRRQEPRRDPRREAPVRARPGTAPIADGLQLEESLQRGLIGKPNQVESVKANFEKRAPKFTD